MNLRDLHYLVALCEHRHFGRAAQASFATQPTLSIQIKKLEAELGIKLVERSNRRVLITPLGENIVAYARIALGAAREIEDLARGAKNPYAGDLRIGLFPTLAPYLLPSIVPGIMKKYPQLKLILIEEKTEVLVTQLTQGAIDAAFLALPVKTPSLEHRFLFEEEFLLAVARGNPWSGEKTIRRSQLRGKELLLLEEGHCLRDQALEYCAKGGVAEFPDFRASSLETLRQMVAADVGMTLIPKMAASRGGGVVYIPFENPKPSRRIGLFWRKTTTRKRLLTELHMELRKILSASA